MTRVKRHVVQFFARKRDADGDRCQWHHGPFTADEAIAWAAKMRGLAAIRGFARVEIVPPVDHAERTRAGMARAAAAGKRIGRPKSALNVGSARGLVTSWTLGMGRTGALGRSPAASASPSRRSSARCGAEKTWGNRCRQKGRRRT